MSRCRRSLRATRALCLAKSDQGERRGGGGSGTAGHPAVCCPAPHGKAHFGRAPGTRLTKRRILAVLELTKCAFPSRRDRRMRFSVRVPAQNAPFRKMCLSSPGQTSKSFTEKRSLQPRCHQKAHSVPITSRKGAVWPPPHLDVPQHLTRYGIKDLFVASMKADDKVWEP